MPAANSATKNLALYFFVACGAPLSSREETNLRARTNHMEQLLLTIPECCRLAAIGRTKFYELIATGEIPIRKIGRKTLVAASDLRDWVERLPVVETRSAT